MVGIEGKLVSNQDLGEYISALSNGDTLVGRPFGYLIFGIKDDTKGIVGTNFDYRKIKQGNEDLENWLMRLVEPKINFNFYNVDYCMGKRLVLLEITAAYLQPTSFSGCEYVRIGNHKMPLKKYPNVERKLWYTLNQVSYEQAISPIQNLHFNQMNIIANSKGVTFNESKLLKHYI